MLKRDSINVQCKFVARQTWETAGRINFDFEIFFERFR